MLVRLLDTRFFFFLTPSRESSRRHQNKKNNNKNQKKTKQNYFHFQRFILIGGTFLTLKKEIKSRNIYTICYFSTA